MKHETFDLIPGDIFSDEYEACKSRGNENTPKERELIALMANHTQHLALLHSEKYTRKLGTEISYDNESYHQWFEMYDSFEKNEGPHPYFFTTRNRVIHYHECQHPLDMEEEGEELFSLFLFFQLKNLPLYEIKKWIPGLYKKHGAMFHEFMVDHLDEYGALYPELHLKKIETWMEKTNQKVLSETSKENKINGEKIIQEQDMKVLNGHGLTNAQWAYVIYLFLKKFGLELRTDIDIAPVAKLLHLITGKNFSTTQKSEFYKRLLKAPSIGKSPVQSISDLNIVKNIFQNYGLNEMVQDIDMLIEKETNAMKTENK